MNKNDRSYCFKGKFFSCMLIAMLGSIPCFAETSLVLHLADSTVIICSLAKQPQMTLEDNTISLSSLDGAVGEWDFSDVESWNFAEYTDVDAVKVSKALIRIEDGELTVSGINAEKIKIYDLGGRLQTPSLNSEGNKTYISLDGFTKGTYLLSVGKDSVKFIVK